MRARRRNKTDEEIEGSVIEVTIAEKKLEKRGYCIMDCEAKNDEHLPRNKVKFR